MPKHVVLNAEYVKYLVMVDGLRIISKCESHKGIYKVKFRKNMFKNLLKRAENFHARQKSKLKFTTVRPAK
jgi:hypothetical protein